MATKVNEDVSDVWVAYKQDQSNQELRNRLDGAVSVAGQIQRGTSLGEVA